MNWADGSWYKGEWKQGIQHGSGELYENGQPVRKGIFENNVLVKDDPTYMAETSKRYKIDKIGSVNRKVNRQDTESERRLPSIAREE